MRLHILLLLLLPALGLAAGTPTKADLEELKSQIRALSDAQGKELRERDALQAELREADLRISRLSKERRQLERKVSESQQRLDALRADQARLARDKQSQLAWLAKTVRASYQTGRQERLKLLLNQEQPDQIARLMRYQEYYQRARAERVQTLSRELSDLQAISVRVNQARSALLDQRSDVQRHAQKLQQAQTARQQTLATLNQSLKERGGSIDRLKSDQNRLEKLLADMQRSLDDIPAEIGGKPFGKLNGKLPWPVEGRIATSYNSRREGALRWQGVHLPAPRYGPFILAAWSTLIGYAAMVYLPSSTMVMATSPCTDTINHCCAKWESGWPRVTRWPLPATPVATRAAVCTSKFVIEAKPRTRPAGATAVLHCLRWDAFNSCAAAHKQHRAGHRNGWPSGDNECLNSR